MKHATNTAFALILLVCAISSAKGDGITGFESLVDWSSLSRQRQYNNHLASSYDRTGLNDDWGYYEGYAGQLNEPTDERRRVTLFEADGPGVMTRFWVPHATANALVNVEDDIGRTIWFTVDGGATFAVDANKLFQGDYNATSPLLFKSPLTRTGIGGQVVCEPITFQNSLKVEWENRVHISDTGGQGSYNTRSYYQCNYQTYSPGATVNPYTGDLAGNRGPAREAAAVILNNPGSNPAGISTTADRNSTLTTGITAGATISLINLGANNSGTIRKLAMSMSTGFTDADLADLHLRVRYDGSGTPAIDVPVGAFFGAGVNMPEYKSLPMGTTGDGTAEDDGMYSYFPMPYRDGVSVELYNSSNRTISIDDAVVEYEAGPVAADAGYLQAEHHRQVVTGNSLEVLSVTGSGHYLGNIMTIRRLDSDTDGVYRGILEGDETIVIDGGLASGGEVLQGTGLEDAYSGGFYYNHVLDQNNDGDPVNPESGQTAFAGLIVMDTMTDDPVTGQPNTASGIDTVSQYRWYIQDAVAFDDGILINQENHKGQDVEYETTAFYYLLPLFGDANGDMFVDLEDFAILRSTFGQSGEDLAADFDGNGVVDIDDYETFVSTLGMGIPSGSLGMAPGAEILPESSTTPEPASLMLVALSAWPILRRRRH